MKLPLELFLNVCSFLSITDYYNLCLTCKGINKTIGTGNMELKLILKEIKDKEIDKKIEEKYYKKLNQLLLVNSISSPSLYGIVTIEKSIDFYQPNIVMELLKDKRVDVAAGKDYAIKAASRGHLQVFKFLFKDERVGLQIYLMSLGFSLEFSVRE